MAFREGVFEGLLELTNAGSRRMGEGTAWILETTPELLGGHLIGREEALGAECDRQRDLPYACLGQQLRRKVRTGIGDDRDGHPCSLIGGDRDRHRCSLTTASAGYDRRRCRQGIADQDSDAGLKDRGRGGVCDDVVLVTPKVQ